MITTVRATFSGIIDRFVAGAIEHSPLATFERVLWRVLHGKLYMNHTTDIAEAFIDPVTSVETRIFAHGMLSVRKSGK